MIAGAWTSLAQALFDYRNLCIAWAQCSWTGSCGNNPMNKLDTTILLVEDDANEVFLMERAFQKANINKQWRVARDGQEAIDYLNHQGNFTDATRYPVPTMMLLDLKMPRKSGFEVLDWLRQQPGLKRLIVVVLSSSSLIDDINRAYDLGSNSYLVKPGDFEGLVNMVKTLDLYWLLLNQDPELGIDSVKAQPVPRDQIQAEQTWRPC